MMRRVSEVLLVLIIIAAIVGYQNSARAEDRRDTRAFFCHELETIKKGERQEIRESLADTRRYLENVRLGKRKPIPNLTRDDIDRGIKRKERRLKELAPDIPRCLSA